MLVLKCSYRTLLWSVKSSLSVYKAAEQVFLEYSKDEDSSCFLRVYKVCFFYNGSYKQLTWLLLFKRIFIIINIPILQMRKRKHRVQWSVQCNKDNEGDKRGSTWSSLCTLLFTEQQRWDLESPFVLNFVLTGSKVGKTSSRMIVWILEIPEALFTSTGLLIVLGINSPQ